VNKGKKPLSVTHPDIAKQAVGWDPNSYSYGSHKVADWRCTQGHVWKAAIKTRAIGGNNCPTCSGHVVLPGFNDLETLHPEIAKLAFEDAQSQDVAVLAVIVASVVSALISMTLFKTIVKK
jgi:hypothetical protein